MAAPVPEVKAGPYPRPCDRCGVLMWKGDIGYEVLHFGRRERVEIWCRSCGEKP